ncbi:transcription repressor OFP14-like [Prosopis cineraria]|uniref:transcription repressor OFP14-like n=1 Tax=Prosopis cineraria TaxID=364024 RepID=UPI00240EC915|nr:transcription repressor OFP14-like [Prosopis cineraria]
MFKSSTMSKKLQNFFQYCLSKLKNSRPQIHPSLSSSSSSPIMRILSGCQKPKTSSFAVARGNDDAAVTLSDVDRFLFENFKSLFPDDDENTTANDSNNVTNDGVPEENLGDPKSGFDSGDPTSPDLLGDLSESSGSRESIVVLAWSANQYEDFRRSMTEMVDARLRNHERVDWGFMEELLLCYLNLNDKKSHKFILGAYVDLVHGLRESSPEKSPPAAKKPRSVRTFRTVKEIGRKERTEEAKAAIRFRAIEKQD